MATTRKIAAIQIDIRIGLPEKNAQLIINYARRLSKEGVQLAVFPECALSGYCFESLEEALENAEFEDGEFIERLSATAIESNVNLVLGFLERRGEQVFNTAALLTTTGQRIFYRKAHLPKLGVDNFAVAGCEPFTVAEVDGIRLGLNICYDCSFPEPSRILALQGADLIVLPTNWPPGATLTADYIPNARALENHVYYLACNRVGIEKGFEFIGKSKICHPDGYDLAFADHNREAVLVAEIDLSIPRNKHLVRVPGKHEIHRFDDRRPELYAGISSSDPKSD